MSAITVEHLHKAYGRLAALRDVSFEVAAGQVVAVLGPNGPARRPPWSCSRATRRPAPAWSACSAPIRGAPAGPGRPVSAWCCSRPASTSS
jgi:hypothetical protein